MIFILDQNTKQIVWSAIDDQIRDRLEGPHGATMLSNGHILLFDNGRYRLWSRVIEFEPLTYKIVWEYRPDDFYSSTGGYAQKLPNGNILVTESDAGHVFEVTPQKEIVWEFYNPLPGPCFPRDGGPPDCHRPIYRMVRYSPEMIEPLLKREKTTT